ARNSVSASRSTSRRSSSAVRTSCGSAAASSTGTEPPDSGSRRGGSHRLAGPAEKGPPKHSQIAPQMGPARVGRTLLGAPGPAWAHPGHGSSGAPDPAAVQVPVERRIEFKAPAPGTYQLPVIKPAPDGAVLDTRGVPRRLHQVMAGKVV